MKAEIILITVFFAERLGHLGSAVADGDKLHAQHIELAACLAAEEVAQAKSTSAFLAGKSEGRDNPDNGFLCGAPRPSR